MGKIDVTKGRVTKVKAKGKKASSKVSGFFKALDKFLKV